MLLSHPDFARLHPGSHPERPERIHALIEALPYEVSGRTATVEESPLRRPRVRRDDRGGLGQRANGVSRPGHDLHAVELRARAACRYGNRRGRARRLRARAPAGASRAPRPVDGLLPLQQRRGRRALAQRELGLRSVAILDWDVHHGNGTQDMFWATTRSSSSRSTAGRSTPAPGARARTTRRP